MPIYEYMCDACSHHIEVLQKFSDSPLGSCEKCGGVLRRLISKTSFQLKGSGWHATDYKPSSKSDTTGSEKNSTDKSSTKNDSQPETPKNSTSENSTSEKKS